MFRKKSEVLFYSLWVVAAVIIGLTAPAAVRSSKGDSDAALAALTGMGGGQNPATSRKGKGGSLFDSSFWNAGVNGDALPEDSAGKRNEEEPEILEKASEGNPNNPQTGMPYTDDQMAQFDTLREKFPNNSLIPHRVTPEMQKKQDEERRNLFTVQAKITTKKASSQEVAAFYDSQMKGMKDRVELLQYVMEKMGDDMDPEMKKKYNEVLESNNRQIQSLEDQKTKAVQDAGG